MNVKIGKKHCRNKIGWSNVRVPLVRFVKLWLFSAFLAEKKKNMDTGERVRETKKMERSRDRDKEENGRGAEREYAIEREREIG